MANRITVAAEIDSRGARTGAEQFNRALSSMRSGVALSGRALAGLTRAAFSVGGALTGIAAAISGREIVQAADNYLLLQARLSLVAREGTTVAGLMDDLAAASARARAPASELTDIYARNAKALEALGVSEAEGIQLAENLAKVTTISGASAVQASAGMMQLSQAIASGRFQGDEFRSVAENLPEIMRILQRETGKTAGELRELAGEGKLTGEVLVNALLNATGDINSAFDQMPQTSGQAFVVMADQASRTFGEIAETAGVSEAWANAFNDIREAMAGPAFRSASQFVADVMVSIAQGVAGLASSVSEARVQYLAWTQAISETAVYQGLAAAIGYVSETFSTLAGVVSTAAPGIAEYAANLVPFDTGLASTANRAAELAANLREVDDWSKKVTTQRTGSGVPVVASKRDVEFGSGEDDARAIKRAETLAARANDRLETDRLRNELLQAEIEGNSTVIVSLENQIAMRGAANDELKAAAPELAARLQNEALLTEELQRQVEQSNEARRMGEDFGRTMVTGLRSMITEGANFRDVLQNMLGNLVEIAAQALIIEPLIKNIGQAFASGGSGAFPAAGGGGGGGGELGSIIGGAAGSFFGPLGTAAGSFLGGLLPFADGGVIQGPTRFAGGGVNGVAGEAGPEAILPLRRGPGGALGVVSAGGNGGGATNVNITITGDATDETVNKMQRVAEQVFSARAPGVVKQSVAAVRDRNVRDPQFLRR